VRITVLVFTPTTALLGDIGSNAMLGSFPLIGSALPSAAKTEWVTCPNSALAPLKQMTHRYAMIDFNRNY
jgi:hypothetical protein